VRVARLKHRPPSIAEGTPRESPPARQSAKIDEKPIPRRMARKLNAVFARLPGASNNRILKRCLTLQTSEICGYCKKLRFINLIFYLTRAFT
jgi:hypothetical protein